MISRKLLHYLMTLTTNYKAYFDKITAALAMGEEIGSKIAIGEIARMIDMIRDNHIQKLVLLDDANKGVFQQLLVSKGIKLILSAQDTGYIEITSSTAQKMRVCSIVLMPLIAAIDIDLIDARNGDNCGFTSLKFSQQCVSPREAVRVFHRRSGCSCLKDIKYITT
jgi:hypothetical protein